MSAEETNNQNDADFQFFLENNTLALSFPWRTSVFLIPISTMIILSFFIQNFLNRKKYIKVLSIILIFFSVSIFSAKNHLIENSNKNFYKKMELINKIKENYVYIDRLLIPVSLEDVRMNIIPSNNNIKKLKKIHLSIVQSHVDKFDLSERESIIFYYP